MPFRLCSRALDDQPRRARVDDAAKPAADLFARAEVDRRSASRRCARPAACAVEDDLPAALTGAGAQVDQAIRGEHHRGIVLDDDERVAGVAQACIASTMRPMSRGCRPIDGSSRTNIVFTSEVPSAVVRLMRLHRAAQVRLCRSSVR